MVIGRQEIGSGRGTHTHVVTDADSGPINGSSGNYRQADGTDGDHRCSREDRRV